MSMKEKEMNSNLGHKAFFFKWKYIFGNAVTLLSAEGWMREDLLKQQMN